ncbi:hypothetical protein [Bradyrhizobium zhanjiangense]|uniref:Uncharacterized protein n=1 Tax=Bradyrhizobium zhanjiangense TaxID=1325107 RepID=A0A4Q0Q6K1_9BRAD|nr:hypothetical protein [Bradyrhizobium zhanjiangense]RXG84832.1 hypothetical protein EAS61_37865 [Bradyrhizobium zhanjiangense]
MSGESAEHIRLVEYLIQIVEARHKTARGIMIFADHHDYAGNRPPMIGGFKPDVFAHDLPPSFRIIGEAKTAKDFEEERSRRQIQAFLEHLALYPNSSFYLAVPWFVKPKANYAIKELRQSEHTNVRIEVVTVMG